MKRERIETEETRERRSILMRQRSLEFKDKYEKAIFPMRIEWEIGGTWMLSTLLWNGVL